MMKKLSVNTMEHGKTERDNVKQYQDDTLVNVASKYAENAVKELEKNVRFLIFIRKIIDRTRIPTKRRLLSSINIKTKTADQMKLRVGAHEKSP